MKNIIFHIPNKINENQNSGSQIRPMKMLNAFKKIGFHVDVVMGSVNDRRLAIKKIKKNIKDGMVYDFMYSESSTMPTALTESHHLPIAPFLDFEFFQFCKNAGLKIGLFYRDIHWEFDQYKTEVSFLKRMFSRFFYLYDLNRYNKYIDILYLPSLEMGEYLPIDFTKQKKALPPAYDKKENASAITNDKLSFLYVGGLGRLYNLTLFSKSICLFENCIFRLCTRESEWNRNKNDYPVSENMQIYHKTGDELSELYHQSDIGILYVEPVEYWKFAMPVKLFEYISYSKPIIAVKGTAVGEFVSRNDIGWSIDYNETKLTHLIEELQDNPSLIVSKIKNIEKIIANHTWEARAEQVKHDLE